MSKYEKHAKACGVDMRGRKALAVRTAWHQWCDKDIEHPEDGRIISKAGERVTLTVVQACEDAGVDYIICQE